MRRLLLIVLGTTLTLPAWADLVLLDNGRHLKVDGYRVENEKALLFLPGGAAIELSLENVERIIDDEVAVDPATAPPLTISARDWGYHRDREPLFRSRYDEWIIQLAYEHDVDAALVSAVIKAESDFDPGIVSHKGAQGLMQLMPATARRFGVSNPFDPIENIRGGTRYLRVLLDMFDGNLELVLAAYNAGEGNVKKYEGVPPFRETRNYVQKIAGYLERPQSRPAPTTSASR